MTKHICLLYKLLVFSLAVFEENVEVLSYLCLRLRLHHAKTFTFSNISYYCRALLEIQTSCLLPKEEPILEGEVILKIILT